ncbi:polysaccharide pyruvyl transferase family protein [Dyadobacter sp. CY323]|uniref:polysaccharide pyruvyl transferase family protein n=1 Tax=Dyadobacter sp. CY323 TaxID=2907302 RepID=UPI001F4651A8|nr:polysaccharide pyruvyl transferase family protein [Dyadobacter sp. CY323]MCE6992760.1 polysaccharide pyruvyl transferase family protein [Dyadobacter sp. CY323]
MKENKKIAIVWANPYSVNLGVGALAYSALILIKDVLDENGLQGDITFIGSYKVGRDSININQKEIVFDNAIGLDYGNLKSWTKILLKPSKFGLSKLFSVDYVFDIGEGDSFADIYGDKRFRKTLNSKIFFNRLGKKQTLLPQTIGPFKAENNEKDAFDTMKKLSTVISRDKQSFEYSAKFLSPDNIVESIDVAFYMPFERQNVDNGKINVGINISGLLWSGGYTGNNQFSMKTDYKDLIVKVLEYFSKIETVQLHLVSHVVPENYAVEDDYQVALDLKSKYPQVIVSPRFKNPIEAKSYISGMDFFSGARMHACIAAFSSGVPVVPMAYSRKFNGLFQDTLNYPWMADCVNTETEVVLDKIIKGFENRQELASGIQKSEAEIIKPRLEKLKQLLHQSLLQ